jgi:hypothetical protein
LNNNNNNYYYCYYHYYGGGDYDRGGGGGGGGGGGVQASPYRKSQTRKLFTKISQRPYTGPHPPGIRIFTDNGITFISSSSDLPTMRSEVPSYV